MTFYTNPGVNADHLVAQNGRLCKVQGEIISSDIPPVSDNPNIWPGYVEPPSFPLIYRGRGQRGEWTDSAWLVTFMGSPSSMWTRLESWMSSITRK
jgi:hypothetical protein